MTWEMPYKDAPTLYVDVDGTLLKWPSGQAGSVRPAINEAAVSYIRQWKLRPKSRVYIWSFGGQEHAENAAEFCCIKHLIDGYIGKPTEILDDDPNIKARINHRMP